MNQTRISRQGQWSLYLVLVYPTLSASLEELEREPDEDLPPGPVVAVHHPGRQTVHNLLVVEGHVHVHHPYTYTRDLLVTSWTVGT